jgi:hypothetical protein
MFFFVLEYKQNEFWFYVFFGIRNINKCTWKKMSLILAQNEC